MGRMTQSFPAKYGYGSMCKYELHHRAPSINDFGRGLLPHASPTFEREYMGLWKTPLDKRKTTSYSSDSIITNVSPVMSMIKVTKDKGFDRSHIGRKVIANVIGEEPGFEVTLLGRDPTPGDALPFLVRDPRGSGGYGDSMFKDLMDSMGISRSEKGLRWVASYAVRDDSPPVPVSMADALKAGSLRPGTWWTVTYPTAYRHTRTVVGSRIRICTPYPEDNGDETMVRADVFTPDGTRMTEKGAGELLMPLTLDFAMQVAPANVTDTEMPLGEPRVPTAKQAMDRDAERMRKMQERYPPTVTDLVEADTQLRAQEMLRMIREERLRRTLMYGAAISRSFWRPSDKPPRAVPPIKPIKPKNDTLMSRLWNAIKNKALSADEKLLRKHGLKTECGDYTEEYQQIALRKICEDKEADILVDLKADLEEQKAEKK